MLQETVYFEQMMNGNASLRYRGGIVKTLPLEELCEDDFCALCSRTKSSHKDLYKTDRGQDNIDYQVLFFSQR